MTESREKLSVSRLKTFQTCPYLYFLKYEEKIQEPIVGNALILGSAVHATLEKYVSTGGELDVAKYFQDEYNAKKVEVEDAGQIIDYGDWDSYQEDIERGVEMVTKYLSKSQTHHTKKIYPEICFLVTFPNIDDASFSGYIDGVTEDLEVLEYKTTKAVPEPYFLENDLQMILYGYALTNGRPVRSFGDSTPEPALDHLFGTIPKKVTYVALHSLYKKRKPWHVTELNHPIIPTKKKFDKLENELRKIWASIKLIKQYDLWSKNLKSPSDSPCRTCAYRTICWTENEKRPEQIELEDLLREMLDE